LPPPIFIVIYLVLSAFVGFIGRNRVVGFAGMFVFSLLLTPFVMGLILLISAPKSQDSTN
jgi:hypothetical protein